MRCISNAANKGTTLMEVLLASVIAAFIMAGTMASYVASIRMTQRSNVTTASEGETQTTQVLEQLRNNVAADDTFFTANAGGGWINVPTSGTASTHNLSIGGQVPQSQFRVTAQDCNGDGVVGDCHAVTVRTVWEPIQ